MSEFPFYSLDADWVPILDAILKSHHLRYAQDGWYVSPQYPVHESAPASAEALLQVGKRRVYLIGSFTKALPPACRQDEGPKAGQFSIDASRGGPVVELTLPGGVRVAERWQLSNGNLYLRSEFRDANLRSAHPPSSDATAAFAAIKRTLQDHLVLANFGESEWVSRAALQEIRVGRAVIKANGKWLGRDELRS